jgi:hypothetical protein
MSERNVDVSKELYVQIMEMLLPEERWASTKNNLLMFVFDPETFPKMRRLTIRFRSDEIDAMENTNYDEQ